MIITDLQQKMCDLLFELDEYLRGNGIEYMLFSGSQLGADRKQGMIPWDDDVDIMMTLENYEKFIEASKKSLPENRKVNALELSSDYLFTYARYIDTTTTAIQRHTVFGGVDPGVKIDVFYTVPTHKDDQKAREHQMEILAFGELVYEHGIMMHWRPDDFFPVYEKEKKIFESLGREAYIEKRLPELKYKYVDAYERPQRYVLFSGMLSNSHLFWAHEMETVEDIDFEGHTVMAAKEGPAFEIELYGESWYKIPGDISVPWHNWTLDLTRPYTETLRGIEDSIDLRKAKANMRTRKLLRLEEQVRFRDAFVQRAEIRNLAVAMSVEKKFDAFKKEGFEGGFTKLCEVLKPYWTRQLNRENRWYGVAMPIRAEIVQAALECLSALGEFSMIMDIEKILKRPENAKRAQGIDRSKALKEAEFAKKLIYAAYIDKFSSSQEMYEKVNSIINEGEEQGIGRIVISAVGGKIAAGNEAVQEALGRAMLYQMRESDSAEYRQKMARRLIDHSMATCAEYGEKGELVILGAYGLEELERQGIPSDLEMSSERLFEKAGDGVTNGFVFQELLEHGVDLMNKEHRPSASLKTEYYVSPEEYERIKKDNLSNYSSGKDGLKLSFRTEDGREEMILCDENKLASTTISVIRKQTNNMCARKVWKQTEDGSAVTEYMNIPIEAENVSPEEFLKRGHQEGILSFMRNRKYLAYYKWDKENWTLPKKLLAEYENQLKAFVEKKAN